MIAVIADDFTGAAEIGGIGLRHGLDVVIETSTIQRNGADLLIIATDTRSHNAKEAARIIEDVTAQLLELKPKLIFKKVDSVLRGHVTEELDAQLKVAKKNRAIVVAGNPVFKRIIKDGQYFIDAIPLGDTCFASDPEYPIKSSCVNDILTACKSRKIHYNIKSNDKLPDEGIIVGDVTCFEDLNNWAGKFDETTVLAGASGFFNALLKTYNYSKEKDFNNDFSSGEKSLFILGSIFPKELGFFKNLENNGHYLSDMPKEIYFNKNYEPGCFNLWVNDIVKGIDEQQSVFVSITHSPGNESGLPERIRENIGKLVKNVFEKTEVNELLVEGGSTTSVVLKYLNIKKLKPVQELDTGVIRMKVDNYPNLYLTTKPGSYFWPKNILVPQDFQKINNVPID